MKTKLLLTALAVTVSLCGYAQTKGTNALGFGITSVTNKTEGSGSNSPSQSSERTSQFFSLGYGHFIKDNAKIGLELNYGRDVFSNWNNMSDGQTSSKNTYGAGVNYQQYYPIVKTLYAYAGGKAKYAFDKLDDNDSNSDYRSDSYSLGAYGGLTWFASKRFAFETTLLSADFRYENNKYESRTGNSGNYLDTSKTSVFGLSTSGLINGLGFKIYLLF